MSFSGFNSGDPLNTYSSPDNLVSPKFSSGKLGDQKNFGFGGNQSKYGRYNQLEKLTVPKGKSRNFSKKSSVSVAQ